MKCNLRPTSVCVLGAGILSVVGASTPANADVLGINPPQWCYNQNDTGSVADMPEPGMIHLTHLDTCLARSIFCDAPQDISRFTVTFRYRATNVGFFGCQHGAAFVIHAAGQGCRAVGNTGGSLGYAPIQPSVAVSFKLSNHSGFHINGNTGGGNPLGDINITSGRPIDVTLRYAGDGLLVQTLVDTITKQTFTQNFVVENIPQILGSNMAYVGFTGSTTCGQCSGNASNQYFSNFQFFTDFACRPDLTRDGVLNSQDFFAFLAAFFAEVPPADYNRDGGINSQDFFDYLSDFFNGCV